MDEFACDLTAELPPQQRTQEKDWRSLLRSLTPEQQERLRKNPCWQRQCNSFLREYRNGSVIAHRYLTKVCFAPPGRGGAAPNPSLHLGNKPL
jgi:hypothetical protein